jgi:mannose-6-phosphate isomerase-like protein (cupin superfamily)
MKFEPINITTKFNQFSDYWSPKIIAQLNDYHFKIAKVQGEFVWHTHPETDEVFLIMEGELEIHFRDQIATLHQGDMLVVPKGIEHKPVAKNECKILLIEPAGTLNTGDAGGDLTRNHTPWI